jgi:hypothetical protein
MREFESLSDLALLEEARARLGFDDERLQNMLKVSAVTIRVWRQRRTIPGPRRRKLLTIIADRLRKDERQSREVGQKLDDLIERIGGVQEVTALLWRLLGPLPGRDAEGGPTSQPDPFGNRRAAAPASPARPSGVVDEGTEPPASLASHG